MSDQPHIVIAGADPAGVFAALAAAQATDAQVSLLCPGERILPTWKDDLATAYGLTREIWDPAELVSHLVSGAKEMIGPFTRFGPGDVETWLEERGLTLEITRDGCVRIPDQTTPRLTEFFYMHLRGADVNVLPKATLRAVDVKSTGGFWLTLTDERTIQADKLILAGGGLISNPMARVIESLDHSLTELHPALTGFQTSDKRLRGVQGSLNACEVRVGDTERNASGALEIEPWGFSGPAVWELSARHTDQLHKLQYRFPLRVSWLPGGARAAARLVDEQIRRYPRSAISACNEIHLPGKLWLNLMEVAGVPSDAYWNNLDTSQRSCLVRELSAGEFEIIKKKNVRGISAVRGGVVSEEIDFRTMASRKIPGLYFAGNVLDVCGAAPDINLQIDWTTGWIAGAQAAELDQ